MINENDKMVCRQTTVHYRKLWNIWYENTSPCGSGRYVWPTLSTVRCRYGEVSFIQNSGNRHLIHGRCLGCFFWVWSLIYVLQRRINIVINYWSTLKWHSTVTGHRARYVFPSVLPLPLPRFGGFVPAHTFDGVRTMFERRFVRMAAYQDII